MDGRWLQTMKFVKLNKVTNKRLEINVEVFYDYWNRSFSLTLENICWKFYKYHYLNCKIPVVHLSSVCIYHCIIFIIEMRKTSKILSSKGKKLTIQ